MTNNDDIVKGDVPPYMNDTLRLFYAELQEGETDYQGMLSRLAVIIDSKARADTSKQIFAELDGKHLFKDNPNTIWCIKEQDYNAIKKQHGVKVD
jgi:hypothetical protein